MLHGDFGIPFQSPTETVVGVIARTWPVTIQVGIPTIILAFTLGITLGTIAALNQNSWLDNLVTFSATMGMTVPNFVVAIWLVMIFTIKLGWLPTGG